MAVVVPRSPMDPALFRFWSRAGRGALIVGIPLILAAGALTATGWGHAVVTTVLWWLALPCVAAFVVNAILGNTRWSPSDEEIAALARSGGPAEREMVAGWRGTPTAVLDALAVDDDARVARAASANLRRRGAAAHPEPVED